MIHICFCLFLNRIFWGFFLHEHMQFCVAVLISLAGLQAPSVLVKAPLIEVTVLISFRESCLIPDAPYQCFPVYYLTLFSLYSVPVFVFLLLLLWLFRRKKK